MTFDEETFKLNHSNDGLDIYLIDNNEIKEKKILNQVIIQKNYFVVLENKFILNYSIPSFETIYSQKGICVYNLNNLDLICRIIFDFLLYIYPFNKKNFILFYTKDDKAKFNIYNANTMKNIQSIEIEVKPSLADKYLFPINANEYAFNNLIINIYDKK